MLAMFDLFAAITRVLFPGFQSRRQHMPKNLDAHGEFIIRATGESL